MRTTRLPVLLLALVACAWQTEREEREERVVREEGGLSVAAAEPVLVRHLGGSVLVPHVPHVPHVGFADLAFGSVPHVLTDTLVWADTATRGDTTFVSRGRAVTTTAVLTDTQWIQLALPTLASGIPFGLFGVWDGTGLQPGAELLTMTYGAETPATLLTRLTLARSSGVKMVIAMTGGARANYLTGGVFDMNKWKARMNGFNTPTILAAIASAVSDGVLIANSVMDEPFNDGGPGNEGNSWGPAGTMSKARVDSLCGYAKAMFPTLPHGVFQDYRLAPETSYQVCDFITSQYRTAKGSLTDYRDGALALCRRDRHACSFAINVLDGGIPARRFPGQTDYAPDDCPLTTTGGRGTYFPNCRMTSSQVRDAGRTLGAAGCFLTGFRYDSAFMASPENQQAFRDVVATLAARPTTQCLRS
jgi:hypothetical protein